MLADLDLDAAEVVASELRRDGTVVTPIWCDLTDPASLTELVRKSTTEYGPVRVLASVAGLSPSMATGPRIVRVNLVGAALLLEAVLPHMTRNGVAVLISSLAAHMCPELPEVDAVLDDPLSQTLLADLQRALGRELTPQDGYVFSKRGENRMARRLASRFGERGSRLVSLSPGMVRTPMGLLEFANQPIKWDMLRKTPLGREVMLHEICDALEFLVSDRASFITGVDLLVDGGIRAALEFETNGVG